MSPIKIKFAFFLFLATISNYAQLGFCPGSKGEPIFTENFGNGTTYGPALPAGTTTYTYIVGAPNDGMYTLFYHSGLYSTWHYSLDHTPDATNGPNGKMLNVNANAVTSGDFYKKIVTGLCVNTTFEFSAWVMNVYNPGSNFCGASQIPINVRFEIWNAAETILLGSGNTGNIIGTATPIWQQFALVFTTASETTVVLKMKNNGVGGCGNDLAIDDIEFAACGDLTTVSSPTTAGTTYTTCNNPASLQLQAATATPYFYQWQSSTDATTWTDIAGENNPTYNATNITSLKYFRVKAAQDLANLTNPFCSTTSNIFTVTVLPSPNPPVTTGDRTICSDETIPALSVTSAIGTSVNWYSAATGGTLLQSNNTSYTPTTAGTYYAETYNTTTNCIGTPRTAVKLTIIPLPDVAITATASVCSGNSAVVNFNGTPNAIVAYTDNTGTSQTINLNASGFASITIPNVTSNSTYTLVSCTSPDLSTCSRIKNTAVTIMVNSSATASFSTSTSAVCNGSSATINFTGTPNAIVTYSTGSGNQTITLNATGDAALLLTNITSTINYTLVNVSLGGSCAQTLSQTISISVNAFPTATISASPLTVCTNQSSTINFIGTPNAILTYTVDGGTNQTITLNASGTANINATGLSLNRTYVLVSAALPGASACSAIINSGVTITVNPAPTASFKSNSPVCNGTAATINFIGTPNALVNYTAGSANQNITLNATGTASLVVPNVTATVTYTLIDVTSAGANGCTKALSQSITVTAVAVLTATISANPMVICSNQTSTLNFTGTPNAVVTYASTGGSNQSVTLNASGLASVITNPLLVNTTYQLIGASLSGCNKSVSGSAVITINPIPNVVFSGDLIYCEGESIAIALSSAIAGTTFNWTVIQNGTAGAIAGSGSQIAQTPTLENNTTGTVTYNITPVNNGCAGNPLAITVTILPLPVPQIMDGVICLTDFGPVSSQSYTLNTNLNAANHSFQWFFDGNPISNAFGNTYEANQIGVYTVIATNDEGCISAPVNALVGEMAQGERLVIQQSETFSDNPMVTITVIGGDGPFSYQLDDAPFQSSNVFNLIAAGTHKINVVDAYCTNLTASITILDYPKYFTPNADGFHDTWNIKGIKGAVIRIFDRYGKLLKQISPDGLGWDGNYNGQLLPATDYWFTINYDENGANKTFKAHFTLKR